ncbi:cytochrome C assembly family protein [Aestuariibacter salexigens]|uniref:cytochrome C assembly family protein n=1 Tax=Aestuariibacter salexigens TaxID=226010 RepID=UPI000478ED5A|nr:cytochrome c biogenesis protein CcsA [Aestuariibacter salexigens]
MTFVLPLLCLLCYAVTAGIMTSRLFHQEGPKSRLTTALSGAALALHFVLLTQSLTAEPGQNMSIINVISLVAWLVSLAMFSSSFYLPNAILLPVVYGFSALVVAGGVLIPDQYIVNIALHPELIIHISLALFAYGCLMIAMLYAIQLNYINGRLKQKKASLLHSSLPPLMAVEHILFKLLLVGTLLLTLSLASGFVFLDDMFAQHQAHKTILSLIAWVLYVAVLIGHAKWGWRGRSMLTTTFIGAFLLTLAYFGSRFVREVLLNT